MISDTPTAKETQKEKGSKQGSSEKIDDDNIRVAVGEVYDTGRSRGFERMTPEGLLKVLQTSSASLVQNNEPAVVAVKKSGKGKDKGGEDVASIKKILRSQLGTDYGLSILDHIVSLSKLEPNLKVSQEWLDLENYTFKALYGAFLLGDEIVVSCQTQKQKGWIYAKSHPGQEKPKEGSTESIDHKDFLEYEDLHPFPLDSGKKDLIRIEYESFNKAADTYFSSLESQKLEMKARQAQSHADKKLEAVKTGHATQIAGLAALQEKSELHARAIELHLDEIESLLRTIRGFVASGMDWIDLAELIKDEARKGNPLARLVDKLKLEVSMVSIKLPDPSLEHNSSDEDDSDSSESDSEDDDPVNIKTKKRQFTFKTDTSLKIDLDIYSTAYANARKYFESRKVAAVKQEKTIVAAEKALKSSEKKIEAELKAATQLVPTTILKIRKPFWFEKFLWFISSENYLVIGGRDAAQNEVFLIVNGFMYISHRKRKLLVKRYLKKDDAYVHADLYGASSVVIKNISTDPIPETTLAQAGTMSVVQSKAWDSKIVTSAWWVSASQVSKTAPSGEYLTTGSFMIRGKKVVFNSECHHILMLLEYSILNASELAATCTTHLWVWATLPRG